MRIAPDTNVLVRLLMNDDPAQARAAYAEIARADLIAIPLPTLCELDWVLRRSYRRDAAAVANMIRALIGKEDVVCDRPAVEAGLTFLERGGDFADGVIAYEGERLGADVFVSFDHNAVALSLSLGKSARNPAA